MFCFYISKDEGNIISKITNQCLDSIFSEGVGSKKSVLSMGLLMLSIDFLFKHLVRLIMKIDSLENFKKRIWFFVCNTPKTLRAIFSKSCSLSNMCNWEQGFLR